MACLFSSTLSPFKVRSEITMTELLEKAFAEAAKLSPDEQDLLARRLLGDLASEELWDRAFAQSQDELAQLEDEALAEYQNGQTKPLEESL
jgi:hypothetical protein